MAILSWKWKFWNLLVRRRRPLWCQWRSLCGLENFEKKFKILIFFSKYPKPQRGRHWHQRGASPVFSLEILSPSLPILGHNWKQDLSRSCFILQGDHLQLPFFISFWRALKNNEIIQLNHFCQPHIETFWYFEVSLWSGEKKSCLSGLCQNNVMAPYCKGWEPKTHLCASNFQK